MTRSKLAIALSLVALGSIFGWSAGVLFSPPAPLPEGATYSLVEVREGELSRSVTLNAVAAWTGGDQLVNHRSGVLTQRLVASGAKVASGEVLYTVDLEAVAVAVGDVPAFRQLGPGARGADVRQVQQMLVATGHRTSAPSGYFDSATSSEFGNWQRDTGQPVTGLAPLGSLLFVQRLPAVVSWKGGGTASPSGAAAEPKGVVGTLLAEGDAVAELLPPEPTISVDLPSGQRKLVRPGMRVSLSFKKHTWQATVRNLGAPREDGSAVAGLAAPRGAESICGTECDAISISGDSSITASITVLAPQSGAIVPSAALVVSPDGSTALVTRQGETIPAIVLATTGGQALIQGVSLGTEVRVPGEIEQGG